MFFRSQASRKSARRRKISKLASRRSFFEPLERRDLMATVDISALQNGSEPSTDGSFRLTRDGSTSMPLDVYVSVTGGTATAVPGTAPGGDYQTYKPSTTGMIFTIPMGSATLDLPVGVKDDALVEGTETATWSIVTGGSYTIGTSSATIDINDNDTNPPPPTPTASIVATDPNAAEANSDDGTFTISLSSAPASPLTINYMISGTATNGTDYATLTNSITFGAGETSRTVTVDPVDDAIYEGNETVILIVSPGTGYYVGSPDSATVTIADDETIPAIQIGDWIGPEGSTAKFVVYLDHASSQEITVQYATADGTAVAPADYTGASGTLTIPAGQLRPSQPISVPVKVDAIADEPEDFFVNLSMATNATIGDSQGIGLIIGELSTNVYYCPSCDDCGCTAVKAEGNAADGSVRAVVPSVGVNYRSSAAANKVAVPVNVNLATSSESPTSVETKLTFNGVTASSVYYSTTGLTQGEDYRFTTLADTTGLWAGSNDYELEVIENFPTHGSRTTVHSGKFEIRTKTSGEFGSGWMVTDLDRVRQQSGGVSWIQGNGNVFFFKESSPGVFLRPQGELEFSSMTRNGDNTITIVDKTGEELKFNALGNLEYREDRNANRTTYNYSDADTDGQVDDISSITDAVGRTRSYAWTGDRVTSVTDFAGLVTSFSYTGGLLTTVTYPDPDGPGPQLPKTSTLTYDGNLLASYNNGGSSTTFTYESGMLRTVTHPDTGVETFSAVIAGGLVDPTLSGNPGSFLNPAVLKRSAEVTGSYTNEVNNTWQFSSDRLGHNLSLTDPQGQVTTYQPVDKVPEVGFASTVFFGIHAASTSARMSFSTGCYTRNAEGLLLSETESDPDGTGPQTAPVTSYVYDAKGNVTQQTLPIGSSRNWTYQPVEKLILALVLAA